MKKEIPRLVSSAISTVLLMVVAAAAIYSWLDRHEIRENMIRNRADIDRLKIEASQCPCHRSSDMKLSINR